MRAKIGRATKTLCAAARNYERVLRVCHDRVRNVPATTDAPQGLRKPMRVELVQTTTHDGLTLHGAYHGVSGSLSVPAPVDTVLLLHGVGSNFYGSPLLDHLSARFAERGLSTLRANTRGHDFVSLASSVAGPQRQGAAYECVAQCHYDIGAWNDFLYDRGARRIGMVGHSLGAVKALYASAFHPHRATVWLVAMSPPRLSHAIFRSGPRKILFARTMALAQGHVDAGRPETLMRVKYPFPLLITAAGYLEKYGPAEKYNFLRFVHKVPCPALFTFGQQELESGSAAFHGLPEALAHLSSELGPLQSVTIAAANHLYDGRCDAVAGVISKWLNDQPE